MSNRASRQRQRKAKQEYLAQHPAPLQVALAREAAAHKPPPPLHTCREATLEERIAARLVPGAVIQWHQNGERIGSLQAQRILCTASLIDEAPLGWAAVSRDGRKTAPAVADWRKAANTLRDWLTYPKAQELESQSHPSDKPGKV